jgi:uncharacterized protein
MNNEQLECMLQLELGRLKHDFGYCLPLDIRASFDPASYGYDDMLLCEPLVLLGQAENIVGEIHVAGQLSAGLSLNCSRCGATFPLRLSLPFTEIYCSQDVASDKAGEQDKQVFSGASIDLTPEALRVLFAELPMKPLCREDCLGLCPLCGADLNNGQCSCEDKETDPRWEKLRELLNDEAGKGV